jgi:SAM-dependent methyltransferase
LVALNLPIVSPLLRSIVPGAFYSNYHAEVDANGYYRECDQYHWILNRWVRGVIEVPVVHCTYLVRRDLLDRLTYLDNSERHEYVVFSNSARNASIPQYIDNRQIYGYITFAEGHHLHVVGGLDHARGLLAGAGDVNASSVITQPPAPVDDQADIQHPEELSAPFERIYMQDVWRGGSGPGSLPSNTVEYRAFVEQFIYNNGIQSVTDLGCGDWQFSRFLNWTGVEYIGLDVVPSLIKANRETFACQNIRFELSAGPESLPGGDLLLCKEMLQHLPTQAVRRYIASIKQRYRYALITNSIAPGSINTEISVGGYRPLRLDLQPFCVDGATVLSYFPRVEEPFWVWKNVVFLMTGNTRAR